MEQAQLFKPDLPGVAEAIDISRVGNTEAVIRKFGEQIPAGIAVGNDAALMIGMQVTAVASADITAVILNMAVLFILGLIHKSAGQGCGNTQDQLTTAD